jgi:transcriptional regulator with XRE-family HTH domain
MTPFGKFMRTLRLDKTMLLKECADLLEVSPAYLSALEHGKKGAPNDKFVERIVSALRLSQDQARELQEAVRHSDTRIALPLKSTPFAFETANAFARELPSLTEDQLKRIRAIVKEPSNE